MSRVDYCNSLLCDIKNKLLNFIQWNQNYAAQVIHRLHRFSHITSALATLCCTLVPWTAGSISKAHRWFIKPRLLISRISCSPILMARLMWPTWGPSGADRTQVGPMLAPWTLLSGYNPPRSCAQLACCLSHSRPGPLSQTWFNLNPSMDK